MALDPDTPTSLPRGGDNAIAVALGILGDEWNLWILRHAVEGACRYGDWLDRGPISNAVLANRLSRLTDQGLFRRTRYCERPARYEYTLTRRGTAVWPVLLSMWAWEQNWAPADDQPLPQMRHAACGRHFLPTMVCAACGSPAALDDVEGSPGPSGSWSRSVPASIGRRRSANSLPSQVLPHTMQLIGDRWSAAMIGALYLGAHRYSEFAERTTAPPATVANRLARFVQLGVVTTEPAQNRTDWVRYRVTPKGAAFFPVTSFMIAWGQHWFRSPEGPALHFTHRRCGQAFLPRLTCSECLRELGATSVLIENPGPP